MASTTSGALFAAAPAGSGSLYAEDGTLTSARTVTMAGNSLAFDGAGQVLIEDSGQVTVAGLTLKENETLATGASPTITPLVNRVNTVTIANSVSGTITLANPTPSAAPMADYIKIGFVNSGAPAQTIALGSRYFGRDGTTALGTITVAFARVRQLEFQYRSDNWGGGNTAKWVLVSDTDGEAGTVVSDLARVRAGGGTTITVTTSAQQIVFGTATTNVGNGYNATTGIFTAPVAGAYMVRATGYWSFAAAAQAGADFILSIRVNGVSVRQSNTENPTSSAYAPSAEVADTLTLAAGDQVSVWAFAGSTPGGAVSFVSSGTWGLFTVDQQPSGQFVPLGSIVVNDQTALGYFDIGTKREQWGTATVAIDGNFTVNLPAPMANINYNIQLTHDDGWTSVDTAVVAPKWVSKGLNSFVIDRDDDVTGTVRIDWRIVGLKP